MNSHDAFELKVFAGRNSVDLGHAVSKGLGIELGCARTDIFPDGELIVRVEEDVRGRDCFIVLSTCTPVHDNLMELLVFADSLKRSSAGRITAVIPYFGYARQDRKARGRTPITAKLVANLITSAGFDRVLALDLHAAQIQGFFDIPTDHLVCGGVMLDYFSGLFGAIDNLTLVSPDVGNMKIAEKYADLLGGDLAVIYKKRISGDTIKSTQVIGDVKGRTVLMVDDMISTAGTICRAAEMVTEAGATNVIAAATHAVCCGPAIQRIADSPISRVVVTDTIPITDRFNPIRDKLEVIPVGKLIADAINHIHHNRSVSALFRQFSDSKR
ncbi:MAG: ribose-phosphate pyrophosphokinase [Planctomycetaceae bacterium]|nr:ribose-phosphate pyrophosphokinase [Planctomycetaceae bacterium]